MLELRELLPHAVERAGDLADLVGASVDDRLVETARRDALCGGLEAPQAPREDPRTAVAEEECDEERDAARKEHAPLDKTNCRQSVVQRSGEQEDGPGGGDGARHLGETLLTPVDGPVRRLGRDERPERKPVVLDLSRALAAPGIADHAERRRRQR